MKCGICQATTMTVLGSDRTTVLRDKPIRNSSDLWDHKRYAHREAMQQNARDAGTRRRAKEERERKERDDLKQAKIDAGRVAVAGRVQNWGRDRKDGPTFYLTNTGELDLTSGDPQGRDWEARYPEPEILDHHTWLLAEIVRLQLEAQDTLQRAWEAGTFISEADIDAVRAAAE